ncbi:hypothetical protein STEG23_015802, partial [Scotinomys teguina]
MLYKRRKQVCECSLNSILTGEIEPQEDIFRKPHSKAEILQTLAYIAMRDQIEWYWCPPGARTGPEKTHKMRHHISPGLTKSKTQNYTYFAYMHNPQDKIHTGHFLGRRFSDDGQAKPHFMGIAESADAFMGLRLISMFIIWFLVKTLECALGPFDCGIEEMISDIRQNSHKLVTRDKLPEL